MSASRPTAVADPQTPASGLTSDDALASRLRVAVVRLNRKLRQQALAGLSPAQSMALGSVNRLGNPTLGELAVAAGLPCAAGVPIGHGEINEPVPLGARVALDATTQTLTFLESAVSEE